MGSGWGLVGLWGGAVVRSGRSLAGLGVSGAGGWWVHDGVVHLQVRGSED